MQSGEYGRMLDAQFLRLSACPRWSKSGWLFRREQSGHIPFDLHIHDLDLILSLSGSIAHEIIEKLHFDHAFIGCFGASMDKQMAYTMETECMTIKALAMKNATKRHLMLDATKLTRIGFYAIAPFCSFDTIICIRADSLPENLPEQFVLV